MRITGRTDAAITVAVCAPKLTVADARYAYAPIGSIFTSMMLHAAPRMEVPMRCFFYGEG